MNHPLLATRLYNCPLLITPGKAEVIEQVFRAHSEGRAALLTPPQALPPRQELAAPGMTRTDAGYVRTATGVAIIPVLGTLVQRAGNMEAASGLTGYNQLAGQLQAALDDPRVDAILLEIDSPGGEANGAFDLQGKIAAANLLKPTWAIANEQAFSSAYLQASGAGKLFVPSSGMVGSVGVVMLHVDQSIRDAKQGIVYTPIFAGARKVDFSSHAPLSEDAMATAQAEVDRVYGMFIDAVANGRGIDPQVVRDTQAGLLSPQDAMAAGMVDGIQSFDETLAALADYSKHRTMRALVAAGPLTRTELLEMFGQAEVERIHAAALGLTSQTGEEIMATEAPNNAAAQVTAAQLAEAEARGALKAKTETEAEAVKQLAAAQAQAAAYAQARISTILTHAEADGRRTLAEHLAFKTQTNVEDAIALLAAAPKESAGPTNLLAAAMAKVDNPKVGAEGEHADDDVSGTVARIMNAGKPPKLAAVK